MPHTITSVCRVCVRRVTPAVLLLALVIGARLVLHAQSQEPQRVSPYFSVRTMTLPDGTPVEQDIINGPPVPPPRTEASRRPAGLPLPATATTLTVPAYTWVYGCSAVSAGMIAAYYDRVGWPNMYTGPANGGVMPLTYSGSWPSWMDVHGDTYPSCPLIATKNGVDGLSGRGSIDDYWYYYSSGVQDPWITNSWTQHTWETAIGDYMWTSQSTYNDDGATSFWNYVSSPNQLSCDTMASGGYHDGTVGRRAFYQAKGYTVAACYNQKTDNQVSGGFSFTQFKAEIDAGRPVMLNLVGHTVVGVGYDAASNLVYLHDTWDTSDHTMTWGTSYAGMALYSVSIVILQGNLQTLTVTKAGTGTGTVTSNPAGINCGSTCTAGFAYDTSVTLTATADSKSTFMGWSGEGCSGTGTCVVTMSQARSVTASFTRNPPFTDDPLVAQTTPIKAIHITELRNAIAALRTRYALSAFTWTDATLTPGVTSVKAIHVSELRTALNAVYVAAGQTPPTYTDPTMVAGLTVVKAVHIMELRAAVAAIW